MVAKISMGSSLYGALAYNAQKINEGQGKLLATNKVFDSCTGKIDLARAFNDFMVYLPEGIRTEKPVLHISLNPHPDDRLTDMEMENIARDYLDRLGYGSQPYMIFKHEDIDRHHLHIVTLNVDERGKRLNQDFLFRRSEKIRKELEKHYGLKPAQKKKGEVQQVARKVDIGKGDVKKQVGNAVKALAPKYRFQSFGEYRALLSLYHISVEEVRGEVKGREYHGLVYSATDDKGNKVGNPFKSSLFGKAAGHVAIERHFEISKKQIAEGKFTTPTKRAVLTALARTYHKDRFVDLLKEKGIDTVFRLTEEGRIYGATFIDHRTGCVLNGSRMGKELSANALQEHFTLPYADEKPIPMAVRTEETSSQQQAVSDGHEHLPDGLGLLMPTGPVIDVEEEAFIRAMRKRKKKKGKGRSL